MCNILQNYWYIFISSNNTVTDLSVSVVCYPEGLKDYL